jgi:two-component system, cell cycle response regulator DivK
MAKILVVEDNEINRDMMVRRLQRRGYTIVTAVDGQQGIDMTQSETPDIVLMDMSLPIVDGWEATRQIKSNPSVRHIPVVGLTAHAMVGDRDKAINAGCDDYATKPVEFEKLVELINRLIAA